MSRALGGAVLLLALGAAGCDTEAYCFHGCEDAAAGGASGEGASGGGGSGAGFSTGSFQSGGNGGMDDCGDTLMSLDNCGSCGSPCEPAGAIPVCVDGECLIQACLEGQYDIDMEPENGCEYACPIIDLTDELCDGLDNDCDTLIDGEDPGLLVPTTLCNTTAGTPCELTLVQCNAGGWSCAYPPEVETVQGIIRTTETLCDGIDGNCDGDADEWFTTLGDSCSDLALGQCKDFGVVACDPLVETQTTCDLGAPPLPGTAQPEACDGIDNDCNGFVDDALPVTAFDMVPVPGGGGVTVDRFEASRPDSTPLVPGILENVACSKTNVLPWTGGGYPEAEAACEARGPGFRLCSYAELEAVCRGSSDTDYPYGDPYDGDACNGVDANIGQAVPTGTTLSCAAPPGAAMDLSGNVAEWTSTQTNAPAAAPDRILALAGGSYLSPEIGLACTIELVPRALESTLLANVGFRCCKDP